MAETMTVAEFYRGPVIDALFENPEFIAPGYGWTWRNNQWRATRKVNGWDPSRVIWGHDKSNRIPTAFIVQDGGQPIQCDWLDIASGGGGSDRPRGDEFVRAVRELAARLGVDTSPIDRELTPEERQRYRARAQTRDINDQLMSTCSSFLAGPTGEDARSYLVARGFPPDSNWNALGLGFLPSLSDVCDRMIREGANEDAVAELASRLGDHWEGRVIIGWRSNPQHVDYLTARKIIDDGSSDKYRQPNGDIKKGYELNFERPPLFGLDQVPRGCEVLVVEGPLDVLLLRAHGFNNTAVPVALAGKSFPNAARDALARRACTITLALDDEDSGREATRHHALELSRAGLGETLFVFPPLEDDFKDVGDVVRTGGVDGVNALRDAYANRPHAWHALVYEACSGDINTDAGRQDAVQKLKAIADTVGSGQLTTFDAVTYDVLSVAGFDLEALVLDTQTEREARAAEEQRQREQRAQLDTREAMQRANTLFERGDVGGALALLNDATQRSTALISEANTDYSALNMSSRRPELTALLSRLSEREHIGLAQHTLPLLDNYTMGLRGLMLLGAPPGRGKTALATQLAVDVVENNADACALIITLEMSPAQIMTRIRSRFARMSWRTMVYGSQGDDSHSVEERERIELADARMDTIDSRVRFLTAEHVRSTEAICAHVDALKRDTGCDRVFVLVDYLQVLPIHDPHGDVRSDRDAEKWQIEQMRRVRDHLDPGALGDRGAVMVVSETTKGSWKDDEPGSMSAIMGAARGAYAPDCIMLLAPYTTAEIKSAGGLGDDEAAKLKELMIEKGFALSHLRIVKGRDGFTRLPVPLLYDFHSNGFVEVNPNDIVRICSDEAASEVKAVFDKPRQFKEQPATRNDAQQPDSHAANDENGGASWG